MLNYYPVSKENSRTKLENIKSKISLHLNMYMYCRLRCIYLRKSKWIIFFPQHVRIFSWGEGEATAYFVWQQRGEVWCHISMVAKFLGPVAQSMVSINQRLIPWQHIGFDTAQPMVKANHALSNSALNDNKREFLQWRWQTTLHVHHAFLYIS